MMDLRAHFLWSPGRTLSQERRADKGFPVRLLTEGNAEKTQLAEKSPDRDRPSVPFTDLHKCLTELEDLCGDPQGANEDHLEIIQIAWLEEYKDHQES